MNNEQFIFWIFGIFIIALIIVGAYGILVTSNLIRTSIGLEIVTKAATLFLTLAGYSTNNTALAQSFIITLIIIEVVVIVVAGGIILSLFKHYGSVDVKTIRNLKG